MGNSKKGVFMSKQLEIEPYVAFESQSKDEMIKLTT